MPSRHFGSAEYLAGDPKPGPPASPYAAWLRRLEWGVAAALLLWTLAVYGNRVVFSQSAYLYVDDAYIHMRFAHHLAQGLGLVWNIGEPPVEGFTSCLYVILLAGLERIGVAPLGIASWIGLACTIAAALLTWSMARLVNPQGNVENVLGVLLLLLTTPFVVWTLAGLETSLYTALVTASVLSYLLFRRGALSAGWVSMLFLLATLTRPEAILLFGVTVTMEGLTRVRSHRRMVDRELASLVGPYLVGIFVYLIWRWTYFGYPLPNTYYAKTGAGLRQLAGGLGYLAGNLVPLLGGIAAAMGLVWLVARPPHGWDYQVAYLAVLLLSSWIGVAVSGGDHFPAGRFLMPTLPLFFVLFSFALRQLLTSPRLSAVTTAGVVCALALIGMLSWRPLNVIASSANRELRIGNAPASVAWVTGFEMMGRALRVAAMPDDSIAVVPIGAIGYFSNLTVIDMVGIVDPVIAHEPFDPVYTATWRPGHDKGDGAYVLSRRPTFIQLVDRLTQIPQPEPDEHALQYKSVAEIWTSEEFHRDYRYYPLRVSGGWTYNLYRRIDR